MPTRLPPPGPSFLREHVLRVRERDFRVGMARPTTTDEGWWLAVIWVADDEGIVPFREFAPAAGPPPVPPLLRLGPALAGELSGWILEEDGRLSIRLSGVAAPDDQARPWLAPAAMRVAIKFEPLRAAAITPNQLADVVATAMRRALERMDRP